MSMTGIFDALFVNQLFRTTAQGQTVYYPHGLTGRGYLVPPDKEPGLRSGLRWLVLEGLGAVYLLVVIIPRLVEAWMGFEIPFLWFLAGAVPVTGIIIWASIRRLSQLGARFGSGLETAGST